MHEVIARRNFRNNAAEFLVFGDLRSNFARQQLRAAQNRHSGFVTRRFQGEDCFHERTVGQALRLRNSATDAVALQLRSMSTAEIGNKGTWHKRLHNYFLTASLFGTFCCA